MAPTTRAMMVLLQLPLAPTTTLTAVAAPRDEPGMNDRAGILAWRTMNSAATPTITESTGTPPPKLFAAVSAKKAHSTPDRLAAMVLLSPVVLPPAAIKHPHATIPAQTGKASPPSATDVHPVIRIPMLMASATSTSMGPPPAEGDCNGRSRHSKRGRTGRNT